MNIKQSLGFTLLELMIVVAIVGVVASIAVPAFQDTLERNRLKEVAEGLKSDLQRMRAQTIKRSCNLQVTFDNASAWNYTIFRTASTCNCPAGANCNETVVNGSQFTGISMSTATIADSTSDLFDFRRGSVLPSNSGNIQFNSTSRSVKVVVSQTGRIRICNITGLTGLPGYITC